MSLLFDIKKLVIYTCLLVVMPLPAFGLNLSVDSTERYFGDFEKLKTRGVVRVLVAADLGFYHMENGRAKGIIAEHINHFEKSLKKHNTLLRIKVIPVKRSELLMSLNNGKGDIAIGNLTITEERKQLVEFSHPIRRNIRESLVTSNDLPQLVNIEDLAGIEVSLRPHSSYYESVRSTNEELRRLEKPIVKVSVIDEHLQDFELIELIERGEIDATIIDSHKLNLWTNLSDSIQVHESIPLRTNADIAWAIRKNSPQLLSKINQYLATAKQGTLLGNVIENRYLESAKWMTKVDNPTDNQERAEMEEIFAFYGDKYEIDWLLLLAQAHQESALDNDRVSHRGAVGIMQIMPKTALDWYVDIEDIYRLENNVHAGTKYLRFIHDRYFDKPEIANNDKVYFSLAAYNAGPAKIRRMRVLAKQQGYDPNKWFNNVEIVAKQNISREPVNYVYNIRKKFIVYKKLDRFQDAREQRYSNSSLDLDIEKLSPYFAF